MGQTKLATLTDKEESRFLLDGVWDEKLRNEVLEAGNWNFATRTSKLEFESSVTPSFGFQRAFTKPTDWRRTITIASDEYFRVPLTELGYVDEQGFFFADIDVIYIRYVSNDTSYGYDLSLWPATFTKYVEAYFGFQALAPKFLQDADEVAKKEDEVDKRLTAAQSKDALNEGVKFPPESSWARARRGRRGRSRFDLGSRSNLTG